VTSEISYVIVYLFTTRGVQFAKLTMCWNIVVFKCVNYWWKIWPILRLFGCKLSCTWLQGNKAS